MRRLVSRIEEELKEQEICAIYDSELERLFPKTISPEKRKQRIKKFADEHQLAVTFYDVGLCAIFEPRTAKSRERDLVLPLALAKRGGRARKRDRN